MSRSVLPLALWALATLPISSTAMNPTDYAPKTNQQCPDTLIREPPVANQTLSPDELAYLAERRKLLPAAWQNWVGDAKALGYDLNTLGITANGGTNLPVIGIAFSGGGHRAAQYGAGVWSAFDARNATAKAKGTGGLFQVASYVSGLSGGSWLLSSVLFHDFPDIHELVLGNTHTGGNLNSWFLDRNLWLPGSQINPFDDENEFFFRSLLWGVDEKGRTGLDTSLTDIWARALGYHFLTGQAPPEGSETATTDSNFFTNDTSHGAGLLWSDIKQISTFQKHEFPVPIVVADSRPPGFNTLPPDTVLFLNSTVYEYTPWELGSYDPTLSAFVDIRFMGTHIVNGKPPNSTACVTEFDQTCFVFGTSSSLFNQIFYGAKDVIQGFDKNESNAVLNLLKRMLSVVSTRADDVANYPNPFQGLKPGAYQDSNSTWIELIDGATNKENIPLGPLFFKARGLDVIVAVDGSADDSNNFPVADAVYASRNRTLEVTSSVVQKFPPIPEQKADIDRLGLSRRPTFFGCDPAQNPPEYPLMIYVPNAPPADGSDPVTNTGTFKLQYEPWHTSLFLDQAQATGFSGFMEGQVGPDPNYGVCLQCAAIDRARLRTNPITPRSDVCTNCFKKYCYDPQNPPPEGQIVGRRFKFKDPDPFGLKSFYQRHKVAVIVGGIFAILALIGAIWGCVFLVKRRRQNRTAKRSAVYARLLGSEWSAAPPPSAPHGHTQEWSTYSARQSYEMPNYNQGR